MEHLIYLFAAYGLNFSFRYRAPWLRGRWAYIDKMLDCAFCTGFWCGLMVYAVQVALTAWTQQAAPDLIATIIQGIPWPFAGGAFSLLADKAFWYMENAFMVEAEDDEVVAATPPPSDPQATPLTVFDEAEDEAEDEDEDEDEDEEGFDDNDPDNSNEGEGDEDGDAAAAADDDDDDDESAEDKAPVEDKEVPLG